MKSLVAFAAGFGAGWVVRSIADSPNGVGVKLMGVAYQAKGQFNRWFSIERERFADMIAEARSKANLKGEYQGNEANQEAA